MVHQYVHFPEAKAALWRLSFKASSSNYVVIRGIRFFFRGDELYPPPIPYAVQDPDAALYPGDIDLLQPARDAMTANWQAVDLR